MKRKNPIEENRLIFWKVLVMKILINHFCITIWSTINKFCRMGWTILEETDTYSIFGNTVVIIFHLEITRNISYPLQLYFCNSIDFSVFHGYVENSIANTKHCDLKILNESYVRLEAWMNHSHLLCTDVLWLATR